MRRTDREITDKNLILEILEKADVCRIAFAVDNEPYLVIMNFGYIWQDDLQLFFHCAPEGRKLDMMRQNSRVCFEIDVDHQLIAGSKACQWTMNYKSMVGYGQLAEVESLDEKILGLDQIMVHYGASGKQEYDESLLRRTMVLKLNVESFTGKAQQTKTI